MSENAISRSSPASFPGKFGCDVTCKACWEDSARMPGKKRKMQNGRAGQTSSKKMTTTFLFVPSTMLFKCLVGAYLNYTFKIFPDSHRRSKSLSNNCVQGLLADLGLFRHFVPGLCAITFGSNPSLHSVNWPGDEAGSSPETPPLTPNYELKTSSTKYLGEVFRLCRYLN